ncbi:NAD(P)H-hydrate dehydratase [Acuticoccus sp. 2012]|uniref:Bifunctional NAD(P)H-hydrate repair enzyme n=2 Tax=Acuticoccus mangrovi TaxID=2796142 RepID=A0A934MBW2_9HYPH|nr:NAD(P)H-hydrate dehydratase [Acuticoccus mangrovi]
MAVADRRTAEAGTSMSRLMERAGTAVADAVAALGHGVSALVLAGPGNNGGDAFVAARVLRQRGYRVAVLDLAGEGGSEEAVTARSAYRGPRVAADDGAIDAAVEAATVIVDGLFGGGLSRDLEGAMAALVTRVNRARVRSRAAPHVVAIDLPSGIDGATGMVRGVAIRADRTVTFECRKPGHLLVPGRHYCGKVTVAEIGIAAATLKGLAVTTFANEPDLWRAHRPKLARGGHKYDRGHAVAVSGPMTATGAARLAITAALRTGAGLATLLSPGDALLVNAAHLTTVMLARVDDATGLTEALTDRRRNAVLLGPGMPPDAATRAMAEAALAAPAAAVLDAGAVVAFAGDVAGLKRAVGEGAAVLTPHAGEFSRLFGGEGGDKLARARAAAAASGAVVVFKGEDTVIAAPDGRAAINANAPPFLATAGAGDVLGGIITGFLAQGVPAFEAAAMGVFLHGLVATRIGPGLIADDLIDGLRAARAAFDML